LEFCKKVCILTETYFPVVGGGESQARLLAEGFSSCGLKVFVLTRRTSQTLVKAESVSGVRTYRVGPVGSSHFKKWGMLLSCIPALVRKRGEYELILVCGFRILGVCAIFASWLLNKRCLLKADSPGEMSGKFFADGLSRLHLGLSTFPIKQLLFLRNKILSSADRFIAISSDLANELNSEGIEPDRIARIPNGVDTRLFHPVQPGERESLRNRLGLRPDDRIVIYTGRLVSYKGLPLLLQVWAKLPLPRNTTLLIVGSGSLDTHNCEAQLKEFVSSSSLQESVCFAGEVEKVDEYLKASDIFVFPTEVEAFGISLVEAMACGLAVIATPVGAAKDMIRHMHNGWLVDVRDGNQLSNAIQALAEDPELSRALGQAARETVESRCSKESVLEGYLKLFERTPQSKSIQR
jgi:glycosyltransferase involved in cell wall biosynthesis